MKIILYLFLALLISSCGSFKETVHKDYLSFSSDSSEIIVYKGSLPNIKIMNHPELYLAVKTKKTGDVIINIKNERVFGSLTLINGMPFEGTFYKFEPDSNIVVSYIVGVVLIVISIIVSFFLSLYYDSWNYKKREEYANDLKNMLEEYKKSELAFKKEIERLEKENDYLQQQLQKRK